MPISHNETLNDLTINALKIIQAKKGYRFSMDPVLLNGFISNVKNAHVADLGTGNGIIPLLLSSRNEALSIVGVEVQQKMAERALRTMVLNGLSDSVRIVHGDIRALPFDKLHTARFDVVTANPPYRHRSTGRVAADGERAAARHEFHGELKDFVRAANLLLKNGGHFYLVYIAERLAEVISEMCSFKLEPKRLRLVHSREGEPAILALVEGRKNGKPGLIVEPPLVVYKGAGRDYTDEVLALYGQNGTSGAEGGV